MPNPEMPHVGAAFAQFNGSEMLRRVHPDELRGLAGIKLPRLDQVLKPIPQIPLPIDPYIPEILQSVWENRITIVVAGPGAGKSTRVPPAILDSGYEVVVTQPRVLTTMQIPYRVVAERGGRLGDEVGFRTRLHGADSDDTRLIYYTDGLALARELSNPWKDEKVLIIDEVHELNPNIECLLAITRRNHRHAVIMSATMDAERLSRYFGGAPIINVPGAQHEVEVQPPGKSIEEDAIRYSKRGFDTLVFLEGKGPIYDLQDRLKAATKDTVILPLHGDLLPAEQARCMEQYAETRVVLATNIAETGVTLDGIRLVIDSGLERQMVMEDDVQKLRFNPIALSSETQRMGRAARTGPGLFISHCKVPRERRPAFPSPPITRSALDRIVLLLACQNMDIASLDLFNKPPAKAIVEAQRVLRAIGCFDSENRPTELGRRVNELRVSPRVGRMLVEGAARGVLDPLITLAAIQEEGSIKLRDRDTPYADATSDLLGELLLFDRGCGIYGNFTDEAKRANALREAGILPRAFEKVLLVRQHLADSCRRALESGPSIPEELPEFREQICAAVFAGNLDRIFRLTRAGDGFIPVRRDTPATLRQLSQDSSIRFSRSEPPLVVGLPFDVQVKTKTGTATLRLLNMATKVSLPMLREFIDRGEVAGGEELWDEFGPPPASDNGSEKLTEDGWRVI